MGAERRSALALLLLLITGSLPAAPLRIGVLSLFSPERLTLKPVPGSALVITAGERTVTLLQNQAAGLRAVGNQIDFFAHRQLSTTERVRATSPNGEPAEFTLSVPGKLERRYSGALEVHAAAGHLSAVVILDAEAAVASAVAAEMANVNELEALKAQAVIVRAYYAASPRRHAGFDFCDTTHCQFHRSPPSPGHPAKTAAVATKSLVLTYHERPFPPLYSASCGGRTRTAAELGLDSEPYPYFEVECAPCLRLAQSWQRRLPQNVAGTLLRTPTESARLAITRQLGWNSIPSNNYRAHQEGEEILLEGRGEGHGAGLCQLGAATLAATGADFREILRQYFPNTVLDTVKEP
jgi:stage II sporulation protein D